MPYDVAQEGGVSRGKNRLCARGGKGFAKEVFAESDDERIRGFRKKGKGECGSERLEGK